MCGIARVAHFDLAAEEERRRNERRQIDQREIGKIVLTSTSPLPIYYPSTPHSSQLLFGGTEQDLSRFRDTSSFASPATIPLLDVTSFTTDHQSTWRSTPLTQTATAHNSQHSFNQDFQLFDVDAQATLPAHLTSSRGQAINRTTPNSLHQPRRHLAPAVSQAQSLQTTTIGHTQLSNKHRSISSPYPQLQHHQRILALQNRPRPPVPKFTDSVSSPTSVPRPRIHSAPTFSEDIDMSIFDHMTLQGGDSFSSLDHFNDSGVQDDFPYQEVQPHTISPIDLFLDDSVLSAPPSTAFPNLSTPGSEYLRSPGLSSGLNTTPMDGLLDSQLDFNSLEQMPSLFPDAYDQFEEPAIAHNASFGSLSDVQSYSPATASPMVRQKSSPGRPPITHLRKASLTAGINKNNTKVARFKALPEIEVNDEDDKETAKRKKNTAAARKSRQRKQELVDAQAAEIERLRCIIKSMGGDPDPEYET